MRQGAHRELRVASGRHELRARNASDDRAGRALLHEFQQAIQGGATALGLERDRPIWGIADPADEAELTGVADNEPAEADTLDLAANDCADARTAIGSGKVGHGAAVGPRAGLPGPSRAAARGQASSRTSRASSGF